MDFFLTIRNTSLAVLVSFIFVFNQAESQGLKIEVQAGIFDRSQTITSFSFPKHVNEGVYIIRDGQGGEALLQVDQQNRGWLVIDDLTAGSTITYHFDGTKADELASVNFQIGDDTIVINNGGRDVLSYFHGYNEPPAGLDERYRRGGYIHPVYTPSGTVLTNHLNVHEHPHHSGIWSAWTNTEFQGRTPDFWNIHQNTGRVNHAEKLEESWSGPVFAGFRSKHYFADISVTPAVTALNEEWQVRVFRSPSDIHIFDLKVTQTANTSAPLYLPEYRYGGVGFRGHIDWEDPDNCTFLTSEGLGRDGHGTRVRWTHIGGHSDGKLAGIAIMSHPENFRHPQTVRIHPDEPFFNYAPTQLGDMVIEPGSPYIVKYRYITYDGEPDAEKLNRLWNDFAYPPGVTVLSLRH
ncbi:MAG: hypothetical protein EA359_08840 [Balneolaceae bacterium]|nr:MAG: hypothetical protein EA359_08840 [Balneolaceae bacterium]